MAVAGEAAAVPAAPEIEVRLPGVPLQGTGEVCLRTLHSAGPAIGTQEAQTIGPAGAQDKPAVQHDKIVPAGFRLERAAEAHRVQVDQEKLRLVFDIEAKPQIAGV